MSSRLKSSRHGQEAAAQGLTAGLAPALLSGSSWSSPPHPFSSWPCCTKENIEVGGGREGSHQPPCLCCALEIGWIDHRKSKMLLLKCIPASQCWLPFRQGSYCDKSRGKLPCAFCSNRRTSDLSWSWMWHLIFSSTEGGFSFAQLSLFCNSKAWEAFLVFVYPGLGEAICALFLINFSSCSVMTDIPLNWLYKNTVAAEHSKDLTVFMSIFCL